MKTLSPKGTARAFTLIELLVILATLILFAVILIPNLIKTKRQALAKGCSDNLREVVAAFRIWTIDTWTNWPMQVPVAAGGTKELVATGKVFVHFRAMSNELTTPKLLVCPGDKAKTVAKDFASLLSDTNVSYFVGTDVEISQPQMLLAGDRNLAFQGRPIEPGLFALTTNNASISWTKEIHNSRGNVGFTASALQFYDSRRLAAAVQNQGVATNRLAIP